MKRIATATQTRALDAEVISGLGLPGPALMEVAALRVAEVLRARFASRLQQGVTVVTGAGNNGGDGWAVARWLHGWGVPIAVWSIKHPTGGDAAVMCAAARRLGVLEVRSLGNAGVIVDALFGTGLSRDVSGEFASAIASMNAHHAPVLAVDVPSGVNADTGEVFGVAVRAECTVTFAMLKPGLLAGEGARLAGEVLVADIGLGVASGDVLGEMPEDAEIAALWPRRDRFDYKTRSGHLLVVAGRAEMAGAAALCCRGALAAGAGLVTLMTPSAGLARLAALPPEVMVLPCGDESLGVVSRHDLSRFTAIAAGPGLGAMGAPAENDLRALWRHDKRPIVFDADALRCAAGRGVGPRVITPHAGEAARRIGCDVSEVERDRFGAADKLAEVGPTALLKGVYSLVAQSGHLTSVNATGTPALASGGTGDVLTGVIGALLGRGLSARSAAIAAAYVHGRAAERLDQRRSQGWTASDVAAEIPAAVEALLQDHARRQ